jgi:hypothetical protein
MACQCAEATVHDQTPDDVWDFCEKKKTVLGKANGTGIFLVPAPDKGVTKFESMVVGSLTYREAKLRAKGCIAFKWFPSAMISEKKIREEKSTRSCDGSGCRRDADCERNGKHCFCVKDAGDKYGECYG